jgi:hypothetical protein
MRRRILTVLLAVSAAATLAAQAPAGWKVRADRSTNASDPDAAGSIKFMSMGGGFHAVNPQAAVYWNPANTATGTYTVKGNFTLLKPSSHTNYYGIVFGGSDLDNAKQNYTYFMVAQNGGWLIKKRDGDANSSNVAGPTTNDAVKKPGSDGKSTNALEVRVGADKVDFAVNGTVVHSMPKSGVKTDGIYGIRVNHQLEVQIDGFGKS